MNKKAILLSAMISAAVTAPPALSQTTVPGNPCAPKKKKVESKKAAPCAPKKKATEEKQ